MTRPSTDPAGDMVSPPLPESGYARHVYENGYVYEGHWSNRTWNGAGTLTMPDVGEVRGFFVDGEIYGHATVNHPDGLVYEGDVVNSKRHGWGKMTLPHGSVLEADWVDGRVSGRPIYTTPDGRVTEGYTEDGYNYDPMTLNLHGKVSEMECSRDGATLTPVDGSTSTYLPMRPRRLSDFVLATIVDAQLRLSLSRKLGSIEEQYGTLTTDPLSTRVLYMPDCGSLRLDQFCDALGSTTLSALSLCSVKNPSALKRELAKDPGVV
ncbi:hypothetical protein KIPB_003934, partial [Kipferlia bialata]|eukprot:g3934.t1